MLATLPGIGRSTAAAIAAFAFGERAAILDGNVKRVLTRVLGFGDDLAVAAHERALWQHAEALLPARAIERYTQGLMDLGAALCSARAPRCGDCPLNRDCVARREGAPERYPVKTRKTQRGARRNALLWLVRGDRVFLEQRPARGVWAGLWALPMFDSPEALRAVSAAWPGRAHALPPIDHALTHFDWRLEPLRHELPERMSAARLTAVEASVPEGRWLARDQALALGLPAPIRKLLLTR
jgi:A/G-specific adenine glycosylase